MKPLPSMTFQEYARQIILPYTEKELEAKMRLDVVFDEYRKVSLNSCTKEKRGVGLRRKVSASTKIPGNWNDFLRDDTNKEELFHYMADEIVSHSFAPRNQV